MVRCACRAERFDFPFCLLRRDPHRDRTLARRGSTPSRSYPGWSYPGWPDWRPPAARRSPSRSCPTAGTSVPGTTVSPTAGRASPTRTRPRTRTAGRPAPAGAGRRAPRRPGTQRPSARRPRRRRARLEGAVREASSPDGFTADSAGSAAAVTGPAEAEGDAPKLNADESSTGVCASTLLADVSQSGTGPVGRMRTAPMVSAGQRGYAVRDGGVGRGREGSVPWSRQSRSHPPATPLATGPATGVPSDTASSGDPATAGADLAAVGFCGDRLGGATMPLGCVSCSSPIRSSPAALDVTTVGELSAQAVGPICAPVQAVLPLIQTLTRLSPDETPI